MHVVRQFPDSLGKAIGVCLRAPEFIPSPAPAGVHIDIGIAEAPELCGHGVGSFADVFRTKPRSAIAGVFCCLKRSTAPAKVRFFSQFPGNGHGAVEAGENEQCGKKSRRHRNGSAESSVRRPADGRCKQGANSMSRAATAGLRVIFHRLCTNISLINPSAFDDCVRFMQNFNDGFHFAAEALTKGSPTRNGILNP